MKKKQKKNISFLISPLAVLSCRKKKEEVSPLAAS